MKLEGKKHIAANRDSGYQCISSLIHWNCYQERRRDWTLWNLGNPLLQRRCYILS